MRRFILAAIALLGVATAASAACTDTLFLQSITVYRQTLKNSATLGTWDSVLVNPWSLADLANAGPVGYAVAVGASDTALHYLRFSSNCGADSISVVTGAWVRDTLAGTTHAVTADTFDLSLKVERTGARWISFNGVNDTFEFLWKSNVFQLGQLQGGSAIEGWSQLANSYKFTATNDSINSILQSISPVREGALQNIESFLSEQSPWVASVGHGTDSVRIDLALYKYSYGTAAPTSIAPRTATFRAMSARSVGAGVEIRLGTAAAVQILSPDGRVARILPAATAQTWDGRDAHGRKLSGIWIVRAEGVGAVPVMVR